MARRDRDVVPSEHRAVLFSEFRRQHRGVDHVSRHGPGLRPLRCLSRLVSWNLPLAGHSPLSSCGASIPPAPQAGLSRRSLPKPSRWKGRADGMASDPPAFSPAGSPEGSRRNAFMALGSNHDGLIQGSESVTPDTQKKQKTTLRGGLFGFFTFRGGMWRVSKVLSRGGSWSVRFCYHTEFYPQESTCSASPDYHDLFCFRNCN